MKKSKFLFKFSAIVFGVFLFLILSSNTASANVSQLEDTAEGPLAWHQYDHYVVQTIEFPEMFVDSIKVKLRHEISNPTTVVRAYIYPVTLDAPPNFYNFCGTTVLSGCYGVDFSAMPIATSEDVAVDSSIKTEYVFDFHNAYIVGGWNALVLEIISPVRSGETTIQTAGASTDIVPGFRWEYTFDGTNAQFRYNIPDLYYVIMEGGPPVPSIKFPILNDEIDEVSFMFTGSCFSPDVININLRVEDSNSSIIFNETVLCVDNAWNINSEAEIFTNGDYTVFVNNNSCNSNLCNSLEETILLFTVNVINPPILSGPEIARQLDDSSKGYLAWHQFDHYIAQTVELLATTIGSLRVKLHHNEGGSNITVRAYIYPTKTDVIVEDICNGFGYPLAGCRRVDFDAGPLSASNDVLVTTSIKTNYDFNFPDTIISAGWYGLVLEIVSPQQLSGNITIYDAGSLNDTNSGIRLEYTFDDSNVQFRHTIPDMYFLLFADQSTVVSNVSDLNQYKSDGVTEVEEGGNVLGNAMNFKANVSSSANNQVKLQVELRRTNEFDGEFLDTSTQESAFVDSGTEATVKVFDLANGIYHWQARAIDSQGNASAWQEFGTEDNIDFIVIDPVIIVPGIGGSVFDPISGFKVIDPIFGTYDNLIEALENKGYVLDETLFPFPYNWMQDNARTAEDLQDKIADIKNICDCQKVDVIAHSMGGLVTRYYIQNDLYQYDIDQFIILGTPHLGAPEIYLLWEGGELQPNFENFLMKLLLDDIADITGYAGAISFIRNGPIESIEQLLAVYNYLRSAEDSTYFNYPDGYPRNVFLEELNSDSGLTSLSQSGVKIYNIAGDNGDNNTINSIRIEYDPSRWPLWLDGYPDNFDALIWFGDHGLERGMGDKSVPWVSSRTLPLSCAQQGCLEQIPIVSNHRDLPSRAFHRAYEILTGVSTDPIEPTHPVLRFLRIAVLSPVDIQVIDPFGRIVGTNFVNNQIINDISGAYYTGSETTFLEYMIIPNPVDGEYRIITRGNDSGSYKIKVNIFSEEELTEETFVANTQSGVIENLNFSLNAEDLELSEIEPEDTTPPVISSTAIIPEYYLNSTSLQFDYSAQDEGVGLFSVSATLDGQNFESGQMLNFMTLGTHTIVITAIDLVNNVDVKIINFNVIYNFGGFLNPIRSGGNYNLGRTLPITFQLFDVNGQFMLDAIAHLTVAKIENGIIGTEQIPVSSSGEDVDNLFRVEDGYYIYNLATSSLDIGMWQLKIVLDDGRVYTAVISLH